MSGSVEGPLGLDPDRLSACVACGLCLPHCPTFRVTGEERYSPRGRIDAMRGVEAGETSIDASFVDFIDTCVQCRGCEPACPSGVEYGALVEKTRTVLAQRGAISPWWQRMGFKVLGRHRWLLVGSSVLAGAQRLRLVPRRLGLPTLPLRRPPALSLKTTEPGVWLFTGCVMDAWQRDTHRNLAALIEVTGTTWSTPRRGGDCCGALHTHAGLHDDAVRLAERVISSMPGDAPIVVDAAGCGAGLQHVGELLGTDAARQFSARVVDASAWLAARLADLPAYDGPRESIVVQDPCHLRHVQRDHLGTRTLVGHVADVVELDDDGLCCGAGGAYSALHPGMAGDIRARKVESIERAAAPARCVVVASGNPGCSGFLAGALPERFDVRHPVDIVADALGVALADG
ncbi:MAG: (Fe-S)-binding protein [Actinomycetota bacterium]